MKSILIDDKYSGICAFCGRPLVNKTYHHLIYGRQGAFRDKAEEDGLKLPACDNCHTMNRNAEKIHGNVMAEKLSKMLGQMAYEKEKVAEGLSVDAAREDFRRRYGKSFL